MKSIRKTLAVFLSILMFCTILSPGAFAYTERKGLVSDPSITQIVDVSDGQYNMPSHYVITIRTGEVITLKAVDSKGKKVKVPKGGYAEWTTDPTLLNSGKCKLTPSDDGSTCTLKSVKGGTDTIVWACFYDKNGKQTYSSGCFVRAKYNAAEWIGVYATLGLYSVCWQHIPEYFESGGLFAFLTDYTLYVGDMLMPWTMFD